MSEVYESYRLLATSLEAQRDLRRARRIRRNGLRRATAARLYCMGDKLEHYICEYVLWLLPSFLFPCK
jgi:hypothetical protein